MFYDATTIDAAVRQSWTQAHLFPIRDAVGALVSVALVHVDLTERVLAEQAAAAGRAELEAQAAELASQADQLQAQTADLKGQQIELERQAGELQATNAELEEANAALAHARDAAARAEADIRAVLASISDPFVVQDHEWRFRYVNAAAEAIFAAAGHTESVLGQVVWDVYPDLVGTAVEREMRRARDERVPTAFTEFHPASGTWSEIRCYPTTHGGLATIWKDVTAERKAGEARHYLARAGDILSGSLEREATSQELARLLVPELADWCAIQLLDAGGALRQVAVAHRDPEKVAWARELNARYPEDPEQPYGAHWVVRTRESVLFAEVPEPLLVAAAQDEEHLRIMREIGFASALTVPLVARGRVLGVLSLVTTSESGRRYGEAELALAQELATRAALALDNATLYEDAVRARVEAEAANSAKSGFLSTMSHELRTPRNAIGGYTELLAMELRGPLTGAQRQDLERVRLANQHLMALVTDILNFARLDAGQLEYRIDDVELAPIIDDLESLIGPQMAAKGIAFGRDGCAPQGGAADTPDQPHRVRADAERLRQILLNLTTNAVKFTESGGRVALACERDAGAHVVRVRVSDTGRGIPLDQLDRIFQPFVQVDRHRTHASQQGVGLGLAISRELARGMGGDLTVESTVGVGSTFVLTLPGVP